MSDSFVQFISSRIDAIQSYLRATAREEAVARGAITYDFARPIGEIIIQRLNDGSIVRNNIDPRVYPSNFPPELAPVHWRDALSRMLSSVNDLFRSATTPPRRDPLAIDLDGDGIEAVGLPSNGSNPVLFDHDANGVKTGTGWLMGDDAWLVRDLDGNGSIDTGRELFGVDTLITSTQTAYGFGGVPYQQTVTYNARNGFEALGALDDNLDGVFNAADAAFTQLKLWQDFNQDGISQSSELFTLADKGIASIALTPTTTTTDLGNGNTVTGTAVVQRSNGSTTQIDSVDLSAGNLNLADNPFYREFTDAIPLTETARGLPEMGGSGWVRDLREAMSLGSPAGNALQQSVAAFAAQATREQQLAGLDGLIQGWAASTGRAGYGGQAPGNGLLMARRF